MFGFCQFVDFSEPFNCNVHEEAMEGFIINLEFDNYSLEIIVIIIYVAIYDKRIDL